MSNHEAIAKAIGNLYDPENMALAWRVLNWAAKKFHYGDSYSAGYRIDDWIMDEPIVKGDGAYNIWDLPPAEAQRAWLDKILELAIEAGLTTPLPNE
jgi:hypothetical protein